MKQLKCIDENECPWVTTGSVYGVVEEGALGYTIRDDDMDLDYVVKENMSLNSWFAGSAKFELIEEQEEIPMEIEKQLVCISDEGNQWFTEGENYDIEGENTSDYFILDDGGELTSVLKSSLRLDPHEWEDCAKFALKEVSPAVADEYEEEEWKRLEAKTEVCEDPVVEEACCDVAFAFQLSRIQEYLRSSGANLELVVHKDFIAINDEDCKEYRGNVEQIMQFIKAAGEMTKAREELERRN